MNQALILQNVSKHIQLDKTEADYFISLIQTRNLKRNEYLLRQGDICKTENFIVFNPVYTKVSLKLSKDNLIRPY